MPSEILAMAEALLVKMVAFILSDFPTPLQKHQDSARTPMFVGIVLEIMSFAQNGGSTMTKLGIAAMSSIKKQKLEMGLRLERERKDEMVVK